MSNYTYPNVAAKQAANTAVMHDSGTIGKQEQQEDGRIPSPIMKETSASPVTSDSLRRLSDFLEKQPNSPVNSDDIYTLAAWVDLVPKGNSIMAKVVKPVAPYNNEKIYQVGDRVSFSNKNWVLIDQSGRAGDAPPSDGSTENNQWKLLSKGGRRKTTRRGKKSRGKKSRGKKSRGKKSRR